MKRKLIRFVSYILISTILLLCFIPVIGAQENPGVKIISDKKDNKLILSLYYENAEKMQSTWFTLGYDYNLIKPSELTHKNGADAGMWIKALTEEKYMEAHNFIDNTVLYSGAFLDDISGMKENARQVHFADIIFDIENGKSADVNGSAVTFDGVICIDGVHHKIKTEYIIDPLTDPSLPAKRISGDIDNDSKISASDARRILRYSVALEDISKDDIAYADIDLNSQVTAADARLALRASVSLEELNGHYFTSENGKYFCAYCKKSVEIKLCHIHKYIYKDCYSTGVCECGVTDAAVRGHIYSASSPKCSVCKIDVISMIDKAETVLDYSERISIYRKNAESACKNGDWYTVIEAALYINVYYEDIISTLKNCDELAKTREEFEKAHKITDKAADSIVAASGDISVSRANAEKVYAAVNKTDEYEKTALKYLDDTAGMYIK